VVAPVSSTEALAGDARRLAAKLRAGQRGQSNIRNVIFEEALDEGLLDDTIADILERQGEDITDYVNDPDDMSEADRGRVRRAVNVSDYPDAIPLSRGGEMDPDYENLEIYRAIRDNPEVQAYIDEGVDPVRDKLGGSRASAERALLDLQRSGLVNREDANIISNISDSRYLESEDYSPESIQEVDRILSRSVADEEPSPEAVRRMDRFVDNISENDDINLPGRIRREAADFRSAASNAQNELDRQSRGEYTAADRESLRRGQPSLVFPRPDDGRRGIVEGILDETRGSQFERVPSNVSSLRELENLNDSLRRFELAERMRGSPYGATTPILPQVEDLYQNSPAQVGVGTARQEARRPIRNPLYELQRTLPDPGYPIEREPGESMRQYLDRRAVEPPGPRRGQEIQPDITGFSEIMDRIEAQEKVRRQQPALDLLNKYVEQYPEVGRLMVGRVSDETPTIKRGVEGLESYVDVDQKISMPETRQKVYESLGAAKDFRRLRPEKQRKLIADLETLYTSGNPGDQELMKSRLRAYDPDGDALRMLEAGEEPALSQRNPVVGGGGYVDPATQQADSADYIQQRGQDFLKLKDDLMRLNRQGAVTAKDLEEIVGLGTKLGADEQRYSYNPDTEEVRIDPEGDYGVYVSTTGSRFAATDAGTRTMPGGTVSRNVLNYLRDNPVLSSGSVSFETETPDAEFSYEPKDIPKPVFNKMQQFINETVKDRMQPGTLFYNNPLQTSDIIRQQEDAGKETSMTRRAETFKGQQSNRRGSAYRRAGFGPLDETNTQYMYMDADRNLVPLQVGKPALPLKGEVDFNDRINFMNYEGPQEGLGVGQSRVPLSEKSYFSADPISMAGRGAAEFGRAVRRTPSSLLPGAADLLPSEQAIRAGYSQGPAAMGRQMARDFVEGIPAGLGAAGILSTPAVAPAAPGIGLGMLGTQAARSLNEVVRQETGEGIVPKVRQALGTAPRTGVASPRPTQSAVTPTIRPLSAAGKKEMERRQNRGELQRRIDLVKERFNPRKGEFGLSELLFGR
jgi:hypothetical protein